MAMCFVSIKVEICRCYNWGCKFTTTSLLGLWSCGCLPVHITCVLSLGQIWHYTGDYPLQYHDLPVYSNIQVWASAIRTLVSGMQDSQPITQCSQDMSPVPSTHVPTTYVLILIHPYPICSRTHTHIPSVCALTCPVGCDHDMNILLNENLRHCTTPHSGPTSWRLWIQAIFRQTCCQDNRTNNLQC